MTGGESESRSELLEPAFVPARMVNEFVYCPRLAFLEWVDGEWDDNLDTIEGRWVHRNVDQPAFGSVPAPSDVSDDEGDEDPGRPVVARSVMLSSERLGVIATLDLLEASGRCATPVDYKRGSVPDVLARAWDPERVQLCAQGLILRDNGYEANSGVLYFAASRTRVEVPFDDALISLAEESIAGLRELARSGRLPPPLRDSPKCPRCSLHGICLPDETIAWSGEALDEARRLVPARPTALPLYVQEQGATIGKRDDGLVITVPGGESTRVLLFDVSSVACFGNVQVTTQALRALCDAGIPVSFHSWSGWLSGLLNAGVGHKNVEVRRRQHALSSDAAAALSVAGRFVEGKIANQRTLLRRNLAPADGKLIGTMAWYARQARGCRDTAQLMGIEGIAARTYFERLPQLLRGSGEWARARFSEGGRSRRPPRDEFNAVLSFLYALLVRDGTLAVCTVGFDPYVGFLHGLRYGRPSLALDLIEEFRPLVADSVAVRAFNQGELSAGDFVRRARGVALTPAGRRAVIRGYERRMEETIQHPTFGYTVSYRRALELQARMLRATVLGEAPRYRPLTTR